MKLLLLLGCLVPALLSAQNKKGDSIWLPLKSFEGVWAGEGGGEPGLGKYQRSYTFIMNRQFMEVRNKSVYPASAKQPAGEIHEDIGYFSYDGNRKTFILRQFHAEGFVNQYKLDSISPDKKTLVFVTEFIENIPKGWRAKETYRLLSGAEIEEIFELAGPGEAFAVYSKVRLRRQ